MADQRKKNPYEDIQAELPQPSGYRVLEPVVELPDGRPAEPEPIIFPAEPVVEAPAAPVAKAPISLSFLNPVWKERLQKFAENPVRVYIAAVIGLGILFGILVSIIVWSFGGGPEGRYDLGEAHSSAAGLKGHLFVEWDKKLKYRLTIEPEEADRQAGFALAVASSPQPLSVTLHLQDSEGFVLCSQDLLLKFDARSAQALMAPPPEALIAPPTQAAPAKSDTATQPTAPPAAPPAPAIDYAKLDAQEAAREKGQEVFQNQTGPDGMVTAIAAQGEIPCSKSAYQKAMMWSFTPNFPSLTDQDALLKRQQDLLNPPPPPPPPPAHKKKPALKVLPFTTEGDDSIVEFDPSFGVIETRGRKLFLIDKATAFAASSAWQDFPVSIHYHCDGLSNCTLMHPGLGALHVKLRR